MLNCLGPKWVLIDIQDLERKRRKEDEEERGGNMGVPVDSSANLHRKKGCTSFYTPPMKPLLVNP